MKHLILRGSSNRASYIALCAVLVFVPSLPVLAQIAQPGYDLFQTGTGTSVDLTSMGIGVVNLQGVPIQSATGNADTIMYRPDAITTTDVPYPVNLFALFMESTAPVTYSGKSADVYITINASGGAISSSVLPQPDTLSASSGTITVHTESGTFDSSITINADVIIVQHGGNPANSAQVLANAPANSVTMSQMGSPYSNSPPSGYPIGDAQIPGSTLPAASSSSSSVTYTSGGIYFKPIHSAPTHQHLVQPAGPAPTPTPTPSGGCASNSPSGGNSPTGNGAKKAAAAAKCLKEGF